MTAGFLSFGVVIAFAAFVSLGLVATELFHRLCRRRKRMPATQRNQLLSNVVFNLDAFINARPPTPAFHRAFYADKLTHRVDHLLADYAKAKL